MKIIVFHNKLGEIVRAGIYVKEKWQKWLPLKQLEKYIEEADEIENKNI